MGIGSCLNKKRNFATRNHMLIQNCNISTNGIVETTQYIPFAFVCNKIVLHQAMLYQSPKISYILQMNNTTLALENILCKASSIFLPLDYRAKLDFLPFRSQLRAICEHYHQQTYKSQYQNLYRSNFKLVRPQVHIEVAKPALGCNTHWLSSHQPNTQWSKPTMAL